MRKWLDEEFEFEIEVMGYLRGNQAEGFCRNGEEIGDRYTCTYGCPVNSDGYGICSKTMMMLYPIMEAVRSGGDLRKIGGTDEYEKDIVSLGFIAGDFKAELLTKVDRFAIGINVGYEF